MLKMDLRNVPEKGQTNINEEKMLDLFDLEI